MLKPVNTGNHKHVTETIKNAEKIPDLINSYGSYCYSKCGGGSFCCSWQFLRGKQVQIYYWIACSVGYQTLIAIQLKCDPENIIL